MGNKSPLGKLDDDDQQHLNDWWKAPWKELAEETYLSEKKGAYREVLAAVRELRVARAAETAASWTKGLAIFTVILAAATVILAAATVVLAVLA